MLKFNDQNIFVGYIKQLLHSFNLPKPIVYKVDYPMYQKNYYLYNGDLVLCTKSVKAGEVDNSCYKILGKYSKESNSLYFQDPKDSTITDLKNPNLIKHLELRSLIYDSYTHDYLGDYLRFIRDYYHLNLMSLYNCFGEERPASLYLSSTEYLFDSDDSSYTIYMIPVKFYKNYIIAIDSEFPIEIICGLYGSSQTDMSGLLSSTYTKYSCSYFNKPFIYKKLKSYSLDPSLSSERSSIAANMKDLKMFIKVPATNNSSIVIIENEFNSGNESNSFTFSSQTVGDTTVYNKYPAYNKAIINIKGEKDYKDIFLPSQSQLLKINSGTNHPFADRLIEYLVGNPITNIDNIPDNIKRLQKELATKEAYPNTLFNYGIWNPKFRGMLYELASKTEIFDSKEDILGYVDKNIESKLGEDIDIYGGNN